MNRSMQAPSPLDRVLHDAYVTALRAGAGRRLPSEIDRDISGAFGFTPGSAIAAFGRCVLSDKKDPEMVRDPDDILLANGGQNQANAAAAAVEPAIRGFRPEGRGAEGNCHICGWPKDEEGSPLCSYPHAMVPDKEVSPGMWTWKRPEGRA